MKSKLFILLFLLGILSGLAQVDITWEDLADITYIEKSSLDQDSSFQYPNFSAYISSLEGKEVSLMGYYLDIDPNGKLIILSKNPLASCFFCGNGGPETAVELEFASKPKFKTDDVVLISGTLKLNKDDVEHLNYILTDCSAFGLD